MARVSCLPWARAKISDLRDLMDDPPGTARWMQYSQNGEHRMTVVVEVRVSHGYVRLQHPSRASDRTEHMDYTVGRRQLCHRSRRPSTV